jgi:hypothetical protein
MTHATHPRPYQSRPPDARHALTEGGASYCWSCLSISCGYQVIPSVQNPPAHRREASAGTALALVSVLRLPLFPKRPGRSFVPFSCFRDPTLQGSVPSAHHAPLSNLQLRPLPTQYLSTIFPFLIVLPKPVSTHPIHRAHNIIVPRHYRPVETLASAAAAGTIGLLETPQSQLHFRQFRNHHLPPLETPLNILTLSDRQIGS